MSPRSVLIFDLYFVDMSSKLRALHATAMSCLPAEPRCRVAQQASLPTSLGHSSWTAALSGDEDAPWSKWCASVNAASSRQGRSPLASLSLSAPQSSYATPRTWCVMCTPPQVWVDRVTLPTVPLHSITSSQSLTLCILSPLHLTLCHPSSADQPSDDG